MLINISACRRDSTIWPPTLPWDKARWKRVWQIRRRECIELTREISMIEWETHLLSSIGSEGNRAYVETKV
jgi:hypothetical protein